MVDRWWELRQQGSATLLMAPTNEAVERLNTRCQQLRLDAGEIAPNTASIVAGRYRLHVGDDIATRHNDRTLVTDTGDTVRNRATWTITDIGPDGYLVATGRNGTVRLPDAYVAAHVELAYACTATATQGRTVRAGLLFSDGATDVRNLYVAMTRGTATNEAYLATTGEETAADLFGRAITTDWIDHPAHVRRSELSAAGVARRPGLLDGTRLRELVDLRHELAVASTQPERDRRRVQSEYRKVAAEREHAVDVIASTTAEIERARAMLDRYDRPLRRAKHEPEISNAKYQFAILPQMIEQARAGVASLEKRAAQLGNARLATIDAARRTRHLGAKVTEISAELDADLRVRARVARLERPAGVVEVLGDRLASGPAATDWDHAAGRLLQHQAAFGIARGLGPQPGYFDETAYAISRAAVAEAAGRLPHLPEPRSRPVPELGL